MRSTRTRPAGVMVVLLFLLLLYPQIVRSQSTPCDNSQAASVIPVNDQGKYLMPKEIQDNKEVLDRTSGVISI